MTDRKHGTTTKELVATKKKLADSSNRLEQAKKAAGATSARLYKVESRRGSLPGTAAPKKKTVNSLKLGNEGEFTSFPVSAVVPRTITQVEPQQDQIKL